jgi:hypothetical protein
MTAMRGPRKVKKVRDSRQKVAVDSRVKSVEDDKNIRTKNEGKRPRAVEDEDPYQRHAAPVASRCGFNALVDSKYEKEEVIQNGWDSADDGQPHS